MQNKGTDYIRRILRDKARQKRWRQIMLCLSCIVVFCTIYVLILPAITLEKKTTCEEEEQIAIQEEQPLVQEEDESIVQSDDSDEVEFVSCEPIDRRSCCFARACRDKGCAGRAAAPFFVQKCSARDVCEIYVKS